MFTNTLLPNSLVENASSLLLLATCSVALAIAIWRIKQRNARALSPPSPPGHWLFGNQQLLNAPWRGILMKEKYQPLYGDIITLSTPFRTTVVLNSLQAINEVLEKQSGLSSDRPRNVVILEMTDIDKTIAFCNHGERHRKQRRMASSALNPAAARSYADLHTKTSAFFLRNVIRRINGPSDHESTLKVTPNHWETMITSTGEAVGRFVIRMTFGHVVVENDPILASIQEQIRRFTQGLVTHYWANDFPILRYIPKWFPGAAFQRSVQQVRSENADSLNSTFKVVLDEMRQGTVKRASYTSKLLESKGGINASQEDIELIESTSQSLFGAGAATTTGYIHCFFFAMSIYPEIAAQLQTEIDAEVGRNRLPTLNDRDRMPYTEAVLQEVFRFYPHFLLGLEHCASEDIEVQGYTIKKGTGIEGNIWAIMRDSVMYPDPDTFNPMRFLKPTPDPDPRRYFFGFGRRVCPGQHIANNSAFTMCTAFMSVFNIVAGEETMRELEQCGRETWKMFTPFGTYEPEPFKCIITPRDKAAMAVLETCKDIEVID